jgi:hypothetical protein
LDRGPENLLIVGKAAVVGEVEGRSRFCINAVYYLLFIYFCIKPVLDIYPFQQEIHKKKALGEAGGVG